MAQELRGRAPLNPSFHTQQTQGLGGRGVKPSTSSEEGLLPKPCLPLVSGWPAAQYEFTNNSRVERFIFVAKRSMKKVNETKFHSISSISIYIKVLKQKLKELTSTGGTHL